MHICATNNLFILQAQQVAPFLERFEGGWATRAIMSQYLRNRSVREQKLGKELTVHAMIHLQNPDVVLIIFIDQRNWPRKSKEQEGERKKARMSTVSS